MQKTLQVLNELERKGVLNRYAIGGAMGAMFYIEPVATFDLDVLVTFSQGTSIPLALSRLYRVLGERGYKMDNGACVSIERIPVRILPAFDRLFAEALDRARDVVYGEIATRVLTPEDLIAIALRRDIAGNRQRASMLMASAPITRADLENVLSRHGLSDRWRPVEELNPEIARIFEAKERRRIALAALSYPEKVGILRLQRMVAPILRARGIDVKPWEIPGSEPAQPEPTEPER